MELLAAVEFRSGGDHLLFHCATETGHLCRPVDRAGAFIFAVFIIYKTLSSGTRSVAIPR